MRVFHQPPGRPISPVWGSASWRDEAEQWIDEVLSARGIRRTGEIEQPRIRAWSTQLRTDTTAGVAWFKACVETGADEAALYDVLVARVPDLVVEPWGTDAARGWLLLPDGGPELRQVAHADSMVEQWTVALQRYSQLQRQSASWTDELRGAGLPQLEPSLLVREWQRRTEPADPVTDALPRLTEAAELLEAGAVPLALQHDDLHAGNVFCADASIDAARRATFFDWGDSYVGHPFMSLLIALTSPSYSFKIEMMPAERQRMIDAYLEPWTDLAPLAELRLLVEPATLLARVGRALGWERSMALATAAEWDEWKASPEHWITEATTLAVEGAGV